MGILNKREIKHRERRKKGIEWAGVEIREGKNERKRYRKKGYIESER